ncbi:MAG: hypothetical protein ACE5I1_00260 [bacterium]
MRRINFFVCIMSLVLGLNLSTSHFSLAQQIFPEKIKCENCQFENPWARNFCTNCGNSLKLPKDRYLKSLQKAPAGSANYTHNNPIVSKPAAKSEKAELAKRGNISSANVKHKKGTNAAAKSATGNSQIESTTVGKIVVTPAKTVPAQSRAEKFKERSLRFRKAFSKPVVIPSLFNVPTANVLGSLDIFFNGGGAFGIEQERHFLGQAGLGLGEIAQVEFSTQSVINSLQRGTTSVPTSAFKMRIVPERDNWPALAASLRGTTSWQHLFGEAPEVSFETRLTKLYIVASKKIQKVTAHVGVGLTDVRVRNPEGWRFLKPDASELQRNIWAPFGGISIRANPKAMVMMEIEGLPSYQFEPGGEYSDQDITNIWAGVIGIRFYFLNWLVADAGVRYRSDFDGIADAKIQANMSVLLPLSRMGKGK